MLFPKRVSAPWSAPPGQAFSFQLTLAKWYPSTDQRLFDPAETSIRSGGGGVVGTLGTHLSPLIHLKSVPNGRWQERGKFAPGFVFPQ